MSGVQTPPKSGSLASACQSCSVGGALIGSLAADSASSKGSNARVANAAATIMGSARLIRCFMRGKITLFESHNETLMDPRVPFKVLRDGCGADILDVQVSERLRVQFEARVIGGEHQSAGGPQQLQ